MRVIIRITTPAMIAKPTRTASTINIMSIVLSSLFYSLEPPELESINYKTLQFD
jgi:hypothetical protein